MSGLANALRTPAEVLEYSPAEIECLVAGLIPRRSFVAFVGKPGSAKSFVALDLGFHMAMCLRYRGEYNANGRVVFVSGEGSAGTAGRIRAWCAYYGIEPHRFDGNFLFLQARWDATDETVTEQVRRRLVELGFKPDLIIFDTLSANGFTGFDENQSAHMKLLMDAARRLQEIFDCTICFVHHMGHNGERERGSSDFRASQDQLFFVSKEGDTVTVRMDKSRDLPPVEPLVFRIVQVEGSAVVVPVEGAAGITGSTGELLPSVRNALSTLVEVGMGAPMTNTRWFAVSGLQRTAFYAAKKTLLAGGYVLQDGKGYVPTNKADELLRITAGSSRTVSRTPPSSSSAPPYKGGGANELKTEVRGVRAESAANQREDGPGLQEYRWDLLEVSQ